MRMLDLFAGRLGWSKAFLARGWEVVAIDLVAPPEIPEGCTFIQADVLNCSVWSHYGSREIVIAGQRYGPFDFACASSPCEYFTLWQLRNFHKNPPHPENGIRLFRQAEALLYAAGIPHVLENVRAAENFIGAAVNHAGSFYLWGDSVPTLLPQKLTKGMVMDRAWCQQLGGHGSSKRNNQTAGFATIPPELASTVADYAGRLIEVPA